MNERRTSVIIPCYNGGAWLRDAVDSALAAGDTCDVVVVDDGSTDATTREVLDSLESTDRVEVIRGANHGVSHARNVGIAHARGEFIVPLDADDRLRPGSVALAERIFDAHPEVDVVAGAQHRFGDADIVQPCAYTGIESMLDVTTIPNTSFFRRDAWERSGGYPEHLTLGEDWAFWMRVLRLGGEVRVVDDVLHDYRVSSKQKTHSHDAIAFMEAQNLVLVENADVYPREKLVEIATHNRSEAVHLRHKYGRLDAVGKRVKNVVARLRS